MTIPLIVAVPLLFAFGFNGWLNWQQKHANAPKWALLTPLIAGSVKGNGVRGSYADRPVTALLDIDSSATVAVPNDTMIAPSATITRWRYGLQAKGISSKGRDWRVECADGPPRHVSGDESVWRQVWAAVRETDLRDTGFTRLAFDAGKGRLEGYLHFTGISLKSDLKDVNRAPDPPTPERFKAQLEFLARLAEVNGSVNAQA